MIYWDEKLESLEPKIDKETLMNWADIIAEETGWNWIISHHIIASDWLFHKQLAFEHKAESVPA